jgi:hypothetical protein
LVQSGHRVFCGLPLNKRPRRDGLRYLTASGKML